MEEKSIVKRKTLVQTKLNFPVALYTEKKTQKNNSTPFTNVKQVIKPSSKSKTQSNRKIPKLQEFLEDSKLEKIDNWHVYCHYCDTGQPIILHRVDDGYRLWQHLETDIHKDNVMHEQTNPSKRSRTTFLHFERKEKEILNIETHLESSKKGNYKNKSI